MLLWLEADRDQVPVGSFRFDSGETRTIKIGSLKSAHVHLPGLARVQAVIRVEAGQASIIDVGGGMCVNGAPVHRAVVNHGDAVSFGPVTLRAGIDGEPPLETVDPADVPPTPEPESDPEPEPRPRTLSDLLPEALLVGGDYPLLEGRSPLGTGRRRRRSSPPPPRQMPPERPVTDEAHALELRV